MALFDQRFLLKLERLHFVARSVFTGHHHALSPSRKLGQGMEFADHRDYTAGDDLRQLDWNLYARAGRLFTKLYHVEEDQAVYFLLDASASMTASPQKFDYARRLCAALGFIALANLDRVTVVPFADEVGTPIKDLRGKRQIHRLLTYLEDLETRAASAPTAFAPVARGFVARFRERGIAIAVSDFLDPKGPEGLDPITSSRFDLTLLHLMTPDEMEPPWRGHVTLEDAETGRKKRTQLTRGLIRAYRKEWERHLRRVRAYALRRRAFYAEVRTDSEFDEVVLSSLRRSGILA